MKVIMCSRHFPKGHPRAGEPTWFVEKIWNYFRHSDLSMPDSFKDQVKAYIPLLTNEQYLNACRITEVKHHTIRSGSRWKAGDMASLRIWSDKPYKSKQIEFAQVEVKRVWNIEISLTDSKIQVSINGQLKKGLFVPVLANNDGLEFIDFTNWFLIHPKAKRQCFTGQIICWSDTINY